MLAEKRTICKRCGGRRDPALGNRMCRPCYNAYVAEQRRLLECAPAEPLTVVDAKEGDWVKRLRVFEAVYARHGLQAGSVWAQVRAVRA